MRHGADAWRHSEPRRFRPARDIGAMLQSGALPPRRTQVRELLDCVRSSPVYPRPRLLAFGPRWRAPTWPTWRLAGWRTYRAGNPSASTSHWPLPAIRSWSSWMSRHPPVMDVVSRRNTSGRRCVGLRPKAGRCSSPPTTWTRRTPSPTGSSSFAEGQCRGRRHARPRSRPARRQPHGARGFTLAEHGCRGPLARLPGAAACEVHGAEVKILRCPNADATWRAGTRWGARSAAWKSAGAAWRRRCSR